MTRDGMRTAHIGPVTPGLSWAVSMMLRAAYQMKRRQPITKQATRKLKSAIVVGSLSDSLALAVAVSLDDDYESRSCITLEERKFKNNNL
jgi:hypothetical protein